MMRKPLRDTHIIPAQCFPRTVVVSWINYAEGGDELSGGLKI